MILLYNVLESCTFGISYTINLDIKNTDISSAFVFIYYETKTKKKEKKENIK